MSKPSISQLEHERAAQSTTRPSVRRAQALPTRTTSLHPLLDLQQKAGNQAVVSLLGQGILGRSAMPLQLRRSTAACLAPVEDPEEMKRIAEQGFTGAPQQLPYLDRLQTAFAPYDLSGAKAYIGGPAAKAANAIGAVAYTMGDRVGFAEAPSLQTAAHEATHVVQQGGAIPGSDVDHQVISDETSLEEEARRVSSNVDAAILRPADQGSRSQFLTSLELSKQLSSTRPSVCRKSAAPRPTNPPSETITVVEGGRMPGTQGYSRGLLAEISLPALELMTDLAQQKKLLTAVRLPSFSWHKAEIERLSRAKAEAENWGPTISLGPFFGTEPGRADPQSCEKLSAILAMEMISIEKMCREFNVWVPQANLPFLSLSRFAALGYLTDKTIQEMVRFASSGLEDSKPIIDQMSGTGSLDFPEVDQQVSTATQEVGHTANLMAAAWLGFRQVLEEKKIDALKQDLKGEEGRLNKVMETVKFCREFGEAVELSMSLMSKGSELMEAGETKKIIKVAKGAAAVVAPKMGVPTGVAELAEDVALLYYGSEIKKIQTNIDQLQAKISAYKDAAKQLGVWEKIIEFKIAVEEHNSKIGELRLRLIARRQAYLKFGEQLDSAARKHPARRFRLASGKERFSFIFLLVSAAREVLALGRGARKQWRSWESLNSEVREYEIVKETEPGMSPPDHLRPTSWTRPTAPDSYEALEEILRQTEYFDSQFQNIENILGPLDKIASELMRKISGSGEIDDKADVSAY